MKHLRKKLFLFVLSVLLMPVFAGSAWAATVNGPATLYHGDVGTYTVSNYGSSTSCKWSWKIAVSPYTTIDSSTKLPSAKMNSNYYSDPGNYSMQVSCSYNGGYPSAGQKAVTIVAMPAPTITGPTTAVTGATNQYTAVQHTVTTNYVSWTVDGTVISAGPAAPLSQTFSTLGDHTVTAKVYSVNNAAKANASTNITVTVTPQAPTITLAGPATSIVGETKQYTVTHNSTDPVTIEWKLNGTVIDEAVGTSVDIPFPTSGTHNVAVSVYPPGYPSAVATKSTSVVVSEYPAPTVTLSGSTTSYVGETKQYSVTHDASLPITIEWTLNGTVIDGATGASVDIPFATAGTQNVAVSVYPTEYPTSVATKYTSVVVSEPPAPTVTLTGPSAAYVGDTKTYTATATSVTGDPMTLEWMQYFDSSAPNYNGTFIAGGLTLDLNCPFAKSDQIWVKAYPTGYPSQATLKSLSLVVSPRPSPTVSIGVPSSSATKSGPISYVATYTNVGTVTLADTNVTLNKTGTANGVLAVSGTGNVTRTVTISTISGDGTLGISIASGTASNETGNSAAAGPSTTFTVDNIPTITLTGPVMSIEGETKQYSVTHNSSLPVTSLPVTIEWKLNDVVIEGITGTTADILFPVAGSQNVAVTVYPNASPLSTATGTTQVTVSVYPAPTVTLTGPITSIAGETKQYSVTHDSGDPATVAWSLNGVVIEGAVGASVDIPFATAGSYTAAVTVYPTAYPNSKGTSTKTVAVSEYPTPMITMAGPTTSYVGETKQYTMTSTSTDPLTIAWTLDGTVIDGAVGASVDIPFTTVGTQPVVVSVYPTAYPGAVATKSTSVVVSEYPAPTITIGGPTTSTVGETKQYTVTHDSSLPVAIAWTLNGTVIDGATATSVDIPFTMVDIQNVGVTVNPTAHPNSKRTSTVSVFVSEYPAPMITIAGSTTSMVGETKRYMVTSTSTDPLTIAWSLNGTVIDGAVGAYVDIPFATAGSQNAAVTVYPTAYPNSKAQSAISVVVSEYPSPTITLDGPRTSIERETKRYSVAHNSSLPVTIEWDVDGVKYHDSQIDVTFARPGTYNVAVTVYPNTYPNSTKTETVSVMVSEYTAPLITIAGPAKSIEGETKRYSVTHNSSLPVTIEWKLDGSVITGAVGTSVDATFPAAGSYDVAVTVYPTAYPNSTRTGTIPVVVSPYPSPTITIDGPRTSTVGKTEQYTVTAGSSIPVTTEWDVNGVKYQGTSVDVSFATAGSYYMGVTVYPTAYPNSKRTATLLVLALQIKEPLVALSTIKSGEVGSPINLSATVKSMSEELPLVVKWEMPDGTSVDALTATYTPRLEDVGKATFTFSAHPEGHPNIKKEAALQIPITKYVFPTFKLKAYHKPTGIVPWTVIYVTDANLLGITEKLSYSWDMGDGAVMPDKNKATHTYTEPGEYTVTLTVSDTRGNSKVVTDTVNVTPVAPISIDSIAVKGTNQYMRAPVVGIFKTTVSGGNPRVDPYRTYAWTVNGQSTGRNSSTTTYTFTEPGTNEVGLTVTSKNGLTGSGTTTVEIAPNIPPECTIEATDYPERKYTKLVAKCTDADGRIRALSWDLGNGQTVKVQTVLAKYAESGTYTVSLTATDDSGGSVTVSKDVPVQR